MQDNFSRAILGFKANTSCKAAIMLEVVQSVYTSDLQPAAPDHCRLMTDDGAENLGPVKRIKV